MNRLGYVTPAIDPQLQAEWIASADRYGQFYDSRLNQGLGQDFENWLGKTAASLGLAWQPGPDAQTSAANFYSAFEAKLVEAAAIEAAQATPAAIVEADATVPGAFVEAGVVLPPTPALVTANAAFDATDEELIQLIERSSGAPIIATRRPVTDASSYTSTSGGGGGGFYSPTSVSASQLTRDALTEKPAFSWGPWLTLAAIVLAASGGS